MKLTIENFQSYRSAEFDFISPGINAIVGQNGHGKSAALRALSSLCLGTTLSRKHKTKTTAVEVDGCRRFFDSKNKYSVDGTVFEAMRKAIPTQITDRLRLKQVNFRSQHQPYFLLAESPGAVAKAMNELTDLGVIDYVSSELKSEGSALATRKTTALSSLKEEQRLVSDTDWAVESDKDLKIIEKLETCIADQQTQIQQLLELINKAVELNFKLDKLPGYSWLDLLKEAKQRVGNTSTVKLGALCESVDDYHSWLSVYDVDYIPQFTAIQKSLSKEVEIAFLRNLIDQSVEYSQDLALCPCPESDIDGLKGIILEQPLILEELLCKSSQLKERLSILDITKTMSLDLGALQVVVESVEDLGVYSFRLQDLLFRARELKSQSADLEFECWTAQEKIKEAFKEAGKCPLCGGLV